MSKSVSGFDPSLIFLWNEAKALISRYAHPRKSDDRSQASPRLKVFWNFIQKIIADRENLV